MKISNKNKGIALICCSSIFVCIGQLFWKLSYSQLNFYLIFGFILYGIGAILMIVSYKFGKVSSLQPLLSINYAISLLLSATILNEQINFEKVIGVLVLTLGVYLIASEKYANE